MGKIFKQLARHWAACLAVVALLFVQAYCDLSLPDYTSKIVDTGIQQGGIESPLPETVRQSTLDALSLLMSEEDADALQNAYGYYLQDDGVLKLRSDLTDAERTALEVAFLLDFFLVGGLAKKAAFRIVNPEKDNPFHLVLAISAVSVLLMCPLTRTQVY